MKVKRRQWKMNLINELSRLTRAEPIPLPLEQVHILCFIFHIKQNTLVYIFFVVVEGMCFETHRSTFKHKALKPTHSRRYWTSAHPALGPSWVSVLMSWTTWSTDECGSAAASTTRRNFTYCPAHWLTRRGRPERLEAFRPAARPAPMLSPHSTARTSGERAEQTWCSCRLILTALWLTVHCQLSLPS